MHMQKRTFPRKLLTCDATISPAQPATAVVVAGRGSIGGASSALPAGGPNYKHFLSGHEQEQPRHREAGERTRQQARRCPCIMQGGPIHDDLRPNM